MGGADVIPGVSGGTIAFITGIYDELLRSIREIDTEALRMLLRMQFRSFFLKINIGFLLPVVLGITTSLVSLAKLVTYLLREYPIQVWSFFFGLILISAAIVLRNIRIRRIGNIVALLIGAVIAYLITRLTPATTPTTYWFIFLSGAIAICAMILPGISGAFILLILGKYEYVINALIHPAMGWPIILIFAAGCLTGLLSFARFLSWILKRYYDTVIAILAGFMLGALNQVWPWKKVLSYRIDHDGNQVPAFEQSILPWNYMQLTGKDPLVFQAVLMLSLGILVVVVIEKIAQNLKHLN